MKTKVICPYCNNEAKVFTGDYVYPHRPDLREKFFYVCFSCDARVGCHKKTKKPMGVLANAELRELRMMTHSTFDKLWKRGKRSRRGAYESLAESLGISVDDCHIGMFGTKNCKKTIELCLSKAL